MSQEEQTPRRYQPATASMRSRAWFFLSLLLTGLIMAWSFSLPFRGSENSLSSIKPTKSSAFDPQEELEERRRQADSYRAAAIQLDREFMATVRKKNARPENLPGIDETRQHWEHRVAVARKHLAKLGDPDEGTQEWQYKQELLETFKDGPR